MILKVLLEVMLAVLVVGAHVHVDWEEVEHAVYQTNRKNRFVARVPTR